MYTTAADLYALQDTIRAGQTETAISIIDALLTAEPPPSPRQIHYLAAILAEPAAYVSSWGLTGPEASQVIAALLDGETVLVHGQPREMSESFRRKQAKKTALPC